MPRTTELETLIVRLEGDGQGFERVIEKAEQATGRTTKRFEGLGSAIGKVTLAAGAFGATAGAALAAVGFKAVKLAAEAEQTAIAFEVMTGSADIAGKLLKDIRTMGAKTPFEARDLADATKTLLNMGRAQNTVLQDLDVLSNIAAGDAVKLSRLALVFGQISGDARLTGENLNQLIDIGFNPLQEIAKKTGESMGELRKRMSRGEIGLAEIEAAFVSATSEGGRFYQMNEKQSQTLLGKWSTLKDTIGLALLEIGEGISKELDLKGAVTELNNFVENFNRSWGPIIIQGIKDAADIMKAFKETFEGVGLIIEDMVMEQAAKELRKQDPEQFGNLTGAGLKKMIEEEKAFEALMKRADDAILNAQKSREKLNAEPITPAAAPNRNQQFREIEADLMKWQDEANKAQKKMASEGQALVDSLRTPQEKLQAELDKARKLFDQGIIDQGTLDRAKQQFEEGMAGLAKPLEEEAAKIEAAVQQIQGVGRGADALLRIAQFRELRGNQSAPGSSPKTNPIAVEKQPTLQDKKNGSETLASLLKEAVGFLREISGKDPIEIDTVELGG